MSLEDTTNQQADVVEVKDNFNYGDTSDGVEEVVDESDDDAADADDASEQTEEEELDDLDIDGTTISLPKSKAEKLKAERLMHADYTKKTQEVAEHRKAVEKERESLVNQAKAQQENLQEHAALLAVGQRIQQFDQVNWAQLSQSDPVQAQSLWIEYSQLKDAQNTIQGRLQQREQTRLREEEGKALETERATANQYKECFEIVAREIKGWSPELARKLDKTASDLGFSSEELSKVKDPRFVKLLHKAYLAEQLLKKQPAVVTPKPQLKPVPQVGTGSASSSKRTGELEMDDYVQKRRKELSQRR